MELSKKLSTEKIEAANLSGRFEVLDGMRGIAALVVMIFHFRFFFPKVPIPPSGYLAVDLFFGLSGFVLVNAYGGKMTRGMSVSRFMVIRLARLYPAYILGTAISVLLLIASLPGSASGFLPLPFALIMVPSPVTPALYPLNVPAWSLFLELVINLALVLFWKRLNTTTAVWICAVSSVFLVIMANRYGSLDFGHRWEAWPIGLARVSYSFFLGVALRLANLRLPQINPGIILGGLLIIFLLPIPADWRIAADLVIVILVFPVLLLAAASSTASPAAARLFIFGGEISYPLYATHNPVLVWFYALSEKLHIPTTPLFIGIVIVAVLGFAWCAEVFFDLPVR